MSEEKITSKRVCNSTKYINDIKYVFDLLDKCSSLLINKTANYAYDFNFD